MKRCFVIGPIGDKMAPHGSPRRLVYEEALAVYEEVIRPACQATDLEPIRADGIAVPGEITDQIFRHLYEDEVVIADVSGANPNVMYELGLRHTRDLLTVQIGEYGQLPFDVHALRTIMFSRSERGLIEARKELETVLRVGLTEGSDMLPATRLWVSRSAESEAPEPSAEESLKADEGERAEDQPDVDENGLIERIVEMETAFPALNRTMEEISEVLERLGAEAEDMGAEMETVNSSGAPAALRLTIITRYGKSLQEPADLLTRYTGEFSESMKALDANVKGILRDVAYNPSLNSPDFQEFLDAIVSLAQATREGMEGLNEFGTIVGSLGHLSKALRRPGQQMQAAIRKMAEGAALIDEWESEVFALRQELGATAGE